MTDRTIRPGQRQVPRTSQVTLRAGGHVPKADALQRDFDYKVSCDVAFFGAVTALALFFGAVGNCQPQVCDDEGQDGGAEPLLFLPAPADVDGGRPGSRTVGGDTAFDDAETWAEGRIRTHTPILGRRPVPLSVAVQFHTESQANEPGRGQLAAHPGRRWPWSSSRIHTDEGLQPKEPMLAAELWISSREDCFQG